MVIKPTVGRVVWYWPKGSDQLINHQPDQPLAAIVCYVHSDRMVNLQVFDVNGESQSRTSVALRQEGDDEPKFSHCQWMPYQIGQAKKHEAK
jgi:hypothetical protein